MAVGYGELLELDEGAGARLRLLAEAGYFLLYVGELDKARDVFEALALALPDDATPRLGLAEAALAAGDLETATAASETALRAPRIDANRMALGYTLCARAKAALGQDDEATALWHRAADIDPDGPGGAAARLLLEQRAVVAATIERGTER